MSFKKVLLFTLFLMAFSLSIYADTYPAIPNYRTYNTAATDSNTALGSCTLFWNTSSVKQYVYPNISGNYCQFLNNGSGTVYNSFAQVLSTACPGGGTISGTNCINATACTSGQTRSTTTGICGCQPPKFNNSFGVCEIPECPSYKVPNPVSGACQIPPVCGSTEHVNTTTNLCELNALTCPGHSHAATTNDRCLPDAPLSCPTGQHDDGTYLCVANDATHCKVNEQSGYINGVKQCIPTPKLDTAQAEAAKAASAQAANDASNANSGDSGLANIANNKSNEAMIGGQMNGNRSLEQIANSLNDAENRAKERKAVQGGQYCDKPPACSGDEIACAQLIQDFNNNCLTKDPLPSLSDKEIGGNVDKIAGVFTNGIASDMGTGAFSSQQYVSTSFWNLSNSTCQTVPMHYKALNYDFDPCTKLETFRNLLGWFFYMFTAFSIVKLAGDLK